MKFSADKEQLRAKQMLRFKKFDNTIERRTIIDYESKPKNFLFLINDYALILK